jgi:hypothetical protein
MGYARYVATNTAQRADYAALGVWATNVWWHFAVTYDAVSFTNNVICYSNGVAIAITMTVAGNANKSCLGGTGQQIPVMVGSQPGTPTSYPFQGRLDDVRVYTQALSAAQISSIYSATTNGHGPGE